MDISKKFLRNIFVILELLYTLTGFAFSVWFSYQYVKANGWFDYLVLFGWLWCMIKGALWPLFIFL